MDQQAILTVFVVIAGLALVLQAGLMFLIYRTSKVTQAKLAVLLPKIERLVDASQVVVDESRTQILEVTTKANNILDITKSQMARVEEVLNDATTRAKAQLERVELVMDDTISRAHETVALVHNGIMRPLREVQGLTAGFRAAIAFLLRGNHRTVAQATHDEEMFI